MCANFACENAHAQSSTTDYLVRPWQTEDGLPENKVMAMLQTRDGYLWVGTYSGLARFDGVRFTVFDNNNTPEMRDSSVTSLYEAPDGTLWIGHATGKITRLQNGRFQAVEIPGRPGGMRILGIAPDADGAVWSLNVAGLLTRVRDGLTHSPVAGTVTNVVEMTHSKSGTIWVARAGRLSRLDHGELTAVEFPGLTADHYLQGICASRDGGLWVSSDNRLRKWKDGEVVQDLGLAPWEGAPVQTFIETRDGRLVAGTSDHGFYVVDPSGKTESRQFCRTNGFGSDWILALADDREGGLWVGTGGAGVFSVRSRNVRTIAPPDQWQGRAVLSVTTNREGGLWVGTEGAGIYRWQDGEWKNFARDAGIRNPYVWAVMEDADGVLFGGTWGGSLYQQRGEYFQRAAGLEHLTTPMPAITRARSGGLWIGTGTGLLRHQAGRSTWLAREEDQPPQDVRAILEEADGAVWFGTFGNGLACLKSNQIQRFHKQDGLTSEFILCLHRDSEGALWIGTFGGGLNRLKNGKFSSIGRQQGLSDGVICHIEEDGHGYFWMSSHGGVLRVSKRDLDNCADGEIKEVYCMSYGFSDGMPTLNCSGGLQPAGCKTADGRMWFPTSKGLVAIDPLNVKTNPLPPPVLIEAMLVDDKVINERPAAGGVLKIPRGRHRFQFQYTGLSFVAPEKVRFKHQLKDLDAEWVDAGNERSARYNYIPPGDYSFRVTASNNDGVWNETGATIAFVVLPYFWQTVWFRALAGAFVVAVSGAIVWFETRRGMRRKLERIERQSAIEHERTRIARDIHDELGSQLTRITMLSESARGDSRNPAHAVELNQIYDTAREVTRAMDEIVWAVNPKHDTLESLANYLEKFAQDLLLAAGIRCRLDMPVQFPPWHLTAELRHNLFLAFKEALHNVVKHAAASEARISLQLEAGTFVLTIEDNGCGILNENQIPKPSCESDRIAAGNGLDNMRRRLADLGGRLDIVSVPKEGTKVIFKVPAQSMSNGIS